MKKIKIMIVDDHKIIRDGIKSMLEDTQNMTIVAEASTGNEAVEYIKKNTAIDLILMDINMPGMDGVEATRIIKKINTAVKVIALTMKQSHRDVREMLQAGASGYVQKSSESSTILQAIEDVLAGKHFFSEEAVQATITAVAEKEQKDKSIRESGLTERELQVFKLIFDEYTNQEIAEKLDISIRTVDAHRRNILLKTGSKNTAALMNFAYKNHLFS